MSGAVFRKGASYIGTATLDHRRQKMFTVVGRDGRGVVSFAHVNDVRRELAGVTVDETEVVKIKDPDGFDYFLSARVVADIDAAYNIVKLCQA